MGRAAGLLAALAAVVAALARGSVAAGVPLHTLPVDAAARPCAKVDLGAYDKASGVRPARCSSPCAGTCAILPMIVRTAKARVLQAAAGVAHLTAPCGMCLRHVPDRRRAWGRASRRA